MALSPAVRRGALFTADPPAQPGSVRVEPVKPWPSGYPEGQGFTKGQRWSPLTGPFPRTSSPRIRGAVAPDGASCPPGPRPKRQGRA